MKLYYLFAGGLAISLPARSQPRESQQLLLKDFHPVSIYAIPHSDIQKARFPVIDMHSHDYPRSEEDVRSWVNTMNETGIQKTIILSYSTGARFDSVLSRYAPFGDRFEVWCGFDYTGLDKPGWTEHALAELERCHRAGAGGVGELGDKGMGELYSKPTPGLGLHIDDPRMEPLLRRCGELHMPVSVHVAEDAWMYRRPDSSNDGLMNAATWSVDKNRKGILLHDQLLETLRHALERNPGTLFIACHLANSCADLTVLGKMFDDYPNLYADIAARYGEIAPIPRFVKAFFEKYSDRLVYGTDMGTNIHMYRATFRILESADEHFYIQDLLNYHWPLYGLDLEEETLRKIYQTNARKLLGR
jgi:predicted TIM-barrel fold metal-dependent hydrolase